MAAVDQSNRTDITSGAPEIGFLGRLRRRLERVFLPVTAAAAISFGAAACDKDGDNKDTADTVIYFGDTETTGITGADTDGGETEGFETEGGETDGESDGSDSDGEGETGGEEPTGTTGDVDTTGDMDTTGEGSTTDGMDSDGGTTEGLEIDQASLGYACLDEEVIDGECSDNDVLKVISSNDNILVKTVGIQDGVEIDGVCVENLDMPEPICVEAEYDEDAGVWMVKAVDVLDVEGVEQELAAYTYVDDGERLKGVIDHKKYYMSS